MADARWEFWIDVGGTFTDCLARCPTASRGGSSCSLAASQRAASQDGSDARRGDRFRASRRSGRISGPAGGCVLVDAERQRPRRQRRHRLRPRRRAACVFAGSSMPLSPAPATNSARELEAPVVAIRYLLGLPLAEPVPPVVLRLGTTRGTNALITRRGARTALVTTRGFGDVLEIGYQARPRLFDLTVRKPPPLTATAIEIDERVTHDGRGARRAARIRRAAAARIAPRRRHRIAGHLPAARRSPPGPRADSSPGSPRDVGFAEVSTSHEVAPLPKIVAAGRHDGGRRLFESGAARRTSPSWRRRCRAVRFACSRRPVGWLAAGEFRGKDSILSGPAGGVVGFSRAAQAAGFDAGDRLRHGRHEHRRRPFRLWPLRARIRNARKPACGSSRRRWRSKPWRPAADRSAGSTA